VDDAAFQQVLAPQLPSFNSATALLPWMTSFRRQPAKAEVPLQFGHGTAAVDD